MEEEHLWNVLSKNAIFLSLNHSPLAFCFLNSSQNGFFEMNIYLFDINQRTSENAVIPNPKPMTSSAVFNSWHLLQWIFKFTLSGSLEGDSITRGSLFSKSITTLAGSIGGSILSIGTISWSNSRFRRSDQCSSFNQR
jgi:hypothetical protein